MEMLKLVGSLSSPLLHFPQPERSKLEPKTHLLWAPPTVDEFGAPRPNSSASGVPDLHPDPGSGRVFARAVSAFGDVGGQGFFGGGSVWGNI